jgi:hypothetical protein
MGEITLWGGGVNLGKNWFFWGTFCIILGGIFLSFHLVFWETHKMEFWHKAFNTIFVTFQNRVIFFLSIYLFIYLFISHTYVCLNENFHPNVFFEITWMEFFFWNWNGTFNSYSIYDWMFIKFGNFLNGFCSICYKYLYNNNNNNVSSFDNFILQVLNYLLWVPFMKTFIYWLGGS